MRSCPTNRMGQAQHLCMPMEEKLAFATSLARSQSNRPFKNFRFVPCRPMFGHLLRRKRPIRDHLSAFRSRMRRRSTSSESPTKSCPTMTSGSALWTVAAGQVLDAQAGGSEGRLTEQVVQQYAFGLHGMDDTLAVRPCPVLEVRREPIERAHEGVHAAR